MKAGAATVFVSAILLTACDLITPEADVEEVRGFAIAPLEISPDELRAHQGETFAVDIVRGLPVVHPCFISGNEDAQPKCEDIMGEGWTLWTEKDLETLTMALDCGDLGPGGGTINLSDCWGLTVYERGTGPGLEDLGGMRWRPLPLHCGRRTWVAYTLKEHHGAVSKFFPNLRIFTDTTDVFIRQC